MKRPTEKGWMTLAKRIQNTGCTTIAEEENPSIYMTAVCLASFINGAKGAPVVIKVTSGFCLVYCIYSLAFMDTLHPTYAVGT